MKLRNILAGINAMLEPKVLQMPVSRFNKTENIPQQWITFVKAFAAKKQGMFIAVIHGFNSSLWGCCYELITMEMKICSQNSNYGQQEEIQDVPASPQIPRNNRF